MVHLAVVNVEVPSEISKITIFMSGFLSQPVGKSAKTLEGEWEFGRDKRHEGWRQDSAMINFIYSKKE